MSVNYNSGSANCGISRCKSTRIICLKKSRSTTWLPPRPAHCALSSHKERNLTSLAQNWRQNSKAYVLRYSACIHQFPVIAFYFSLCTSCMKMEISAIGEHDSALEPKPCMATLILMHWNAISLYLNQRFVKSLIGCFCYCSLSDGHNFNNYMGYLLFYSLSNICDTWQNVYYTIVHIINYHCTHDAGIKIITVYEMQAYFLNFMRKRKKKREIPSIFKRYFITKGK